MTRSEVDKLGTWWMIERDSTDGPPEYFAWRYRPDQLSKTRPHGSHCWTPDWDKGERFATREEAEAHTNGDPLLHIVEHAMIGGTAELSEKCTQTSDTPPPPSGRLDTVMLGRFVAQYDEGAAGFFIDADEAQEVALQVRAALSLGVRIMDEVHNDPSIPTEVACKVYTAIKRAGTIPTPPESST